MGSSKRTYRNALRCLYECHIAYSWNRRIIAAIVRGGLKAFGIEMPVFPQIRRQAVLAVFVLFLIILSGVVYLPHIGTKSNIQMQRQQ